MKTTAVIDGLRAEPDLREKQLLFVVARLAMRQHVLENAVRALFEYESPETDDEKANAIFSLHLSLAESDDPGKVMAFAAAHAELLPVSMR